ncbi:MAG TPA: proline--tRNA ligase [Actinopolymorphaceae bacterium]
MILRMSTLFLRTLREDPADAEVPSHRLLLRAGFIRRTAPGIYSWLPLGWRVHRQVERVIREEMEAVGAQEIHLPALLPREPYDRTGRWDEYGADMFRLRDRKGNDMLLGPTHEEAFTLLVKDVLSSYRDLPMTLYQVQWKYRDEPRPRAGLLRGREFAMKDAYSFDLDDAGLEKSYARQREAYQRIFERLGLQYAIVQAMSGAMGGSLSEEFLSPLEVGEDTYVRCPACGYASNTEAVEVVAPRARPYDDLPDAHVEDTPDTPTIQSLVDLLNARPDLRRSDRPWQASDTLKNVAVQVTSPTGETQLLVIGIPGDREVDEKRLAAQLYPSTVEPLTEDGFAANPALVRGYIGPRALGEEKGIRYLVDPRVAPGTRWVTGADEPGKHVIDLVVGRDFRPDGTILAAEVREGDPCPRCDAPLTTTRGIEVGHIFALGRKYAEALGLEVLDENGEQVVVTMGSYGIGIDRLLAVIAENNHDDAGLVWPREVAPADVHVVATGRGDAPFDAAERLAAELSEQGLTVLLDDRRGASAGEKFNDADLIGVPTIVVCGRRIVDGLVEIKDRRTSERIDVPLDQATREILTETRNR